MPELGIYSQGKTTAIRHIDRIVDGVDSPADHSVGRVYAANGRLFVQSDRSMQLPVYKVTGQNSE